MKCVILDQGLTCHGEFLPFGYSCSLGRKRENFRTAFSKDIFINLQEAINVRMFCL